jgi:hypothetical protein
MKKFLILFRHGFGFQKAQLIFWAQTQPVVTTLFQNPNQPYKNLKRVHIVRKRSKERVATTDWIQAQKLVDPPEPKTVLRNI